MPPRRRSDAPGLPSALPPALPPALDPAAVEALGRRLAEGGRPRVVLLGGSAGLPAGTRGTVVRVGDPSEGAEHITVRVDKDELPFAPAELTVAGRGTSRAVHLAQEAREQARSAAPPRGRTAARRPAVPTPQPSAPVPVVPSPPPAAPASGRAAEGPSAPRTTRRRPVGAGVPAVTLTLRFVDGEWTVEAERGSKRVGRRRPLAAGAVKEAAAALGDPSLDALVAETLDAHRAEVQGRAAALRAELAALEATLHRLDG